MGLPLPRVVADVGPGGPLVTSMRGMNALASDMLSNKIKGVQADYAPLTTQANAYSKLAYAQLMGPQFLAKLMGHDPILANMTEDQKRAALDKLYGAGSGQGTGNALMNMPSPPAQNQGSFGNFLVNKVRGLLGGQQAQPQADNALGYPYSASIDQSKQPNQNNVAQGNAPQIQNPNSGYAYDAQGNNVIASPQEVASIANSNNQNAQAQPYRTFSENTANQASIVAQGKEQGKIRAKAIDEMDQQYQQAIQAEVPLQHMNEIVTNPIFSNMRNYPWFQGAQLNMKSKVGTPEEQRLIGDFQTTAQNAVAQTVMGFRGRILDKEVDMANKMKINPEDTFQVILGKLPSIEAFNEFTKQRSRMASQLMDKQHISRGDALEIADKQLDSKAIREKIEKMLDYPVTIRSKKTGQSRTIPVSEARKLGVPNV